MEVRRVKILFSGLLVAGAVVLSGCYHRTTHVTVHDPAEVTLFVEKTSGVREQLIGPSEKDEIVVARKSNQVVATIPGVDASVTLGSSKGTVFAVRQDKALRFQCEGCLDTRLNLVNAEGEMAVFDDFKGKRLVQNKKQKFLSPPLSFDVEGGTTFGYGGIVYQWIYINGVMETPWENVKEIKTVHHPARKIGFLLIPGISALTLGIVTFADPAGVGVIGNGFFTATGIVNLVAGVVLTALGIMHLAIKQKEEVVWSTKPPSSELEAPDEEPEADLDVGGDPPNGEEGDGDEGDGEEDEGEPIPSRSGKRNPYES